MSSNLDDPFNLYDLAPVVAIWPTAGRAWGLSRSSTYSLVARGLFPVRVIKLGRRYCVLSSEPRASLGLPEQPGTRAGTTS